MITTCNKCGNFFDNIKQSWECPHDGPGLVGSKQPLDGPRTMPSEIPQEQYPPIRVLVDGKMVTAQIKDGRRYHFCSLWVGDRCLGDWSWKTLALMLAGNEVIKG